MKLRGLQELPSKTALTTPPTSVHRLAHRLVRQFDHQSAVPIQLYENDSTHPGLARGSYRDAWAIAGAGAAILHLPAGRMHVVAYPGPRQPCGRPPLPGLLNLADHLYRARRPRRPAALCCRSESTTCMRLLVARVVDHMHAPSSRGGRPHACVESNAPGTCTCTLYHCTSYSWR